MGARGQDGGNAVRKKGMEGVAVGAHSADETTLSGKLSMKGRRSASFLPKKSG